MKQGKVAVCVYHYEPKSNGDGEESWVVYLDYEERKPRVAESAFVKRWKTEGEAEMHAEIIRCALAWEPSRAGRRWRTRTRPGRRAGDKAGR